MLVVESWLHYKRLSDCKVELVRNFNVFLVARNKMDLYAQLFHQRSVVCYVFGEFLAIGTPNYFRVKALRGMNYSKVFSVYCKIIIRISLSYRIL